MSDTVDRPVPADAAHGELAEAVARVEHDKARVVLTREGRPVAALVPIEDMEILEAWEDEQDARLADETIAQWEAEGRPLGPTHEELLTRYGITPEPE